MSAVEDPTRAVRFWMEGAPSADGDREVTRVVRAAIARSGRPAVLYAIEERLGRLAAVRIMDLLAADGGD